MIPLSFRDMLLVMHFPLSDPSRELTVANDKHILINHLRCLLKEMRDEM